jgi:hypothetical protein
MHVIHANISPLHGCSRLHVSGTRRAARERGFRVNPGLEQKIPERFTQMTGVAHNPDIQPKLLLVLVVMQAAVQIQVYISDY